jgi:hypothetical protein
MHKRLASHLLRHILAKGVFTLLKLARWTEDDHFVWHAEEMLEAAACRTLHRDCPFAEETDRG